MLQYLFRLTAGRQEQDPGERDLKVEDINTKLNELAAAGSAEEKTAVLQWLVQRSSARMLKWITQIILKDLKVKCSEVAKTCKETPLYLARIYQKLISIAVAETPVIQGNCFDLGTLALLLCAVHQRVHHRSFSRSFTN